MKKFITSFFVLVFLTSNAYAATLEVGVDRSYTTIQSAVDAARPGDTVLVHPGIYTETVSTKRDGTDHQRITICALYEATNTQDQNLWSIVDGEYERSTAFNILHNYHTIEGFRIIKHYHTQARSSVVYASHSDGLKIRYNFFENNSRNESAVKTADLKLLYGSDIVVRCNKFYGVIGNGGHALHVGVECYGVENLLLAYNEVTGYSYYGGMKIGGDNTNLIVRYNYFHDISSNAIAALYLRDFDGGKIHNNLFVNPGLWNHIYYQTHELHPSINNEIYNNTFVGASIAVKTFETYAPSSQEEYLNVYNNVIEEAEVGPYTWNRYGVAIHQVLSSNVYHAIGSVSHSANTIVIPGGERETALEPLDENYLSVAPFQDRGANLIVNTWPFVRRNVFRITYTVFPNALTGIPYSQTLTALNGTTPYTWRIQRGSLPTGLRLNEQTGEISGIPTNVEVRDFAVRVSDSSSRANVAVKEFRLTVDPNHVDNKD